MITKEQWDVGIKRLLDGLDSFNSKDSCKSKCYHFIVDGDLVGYIRQDVLDALKQHYKSYFEIDDNSKSVEFNSKYDDLDKRTFAINTVLADMRAKNLFLSLKGWRNETYDIKTKFSSSTLFRMERSGVPIFGVISRGCHINGYVIDNNNEYKLWIARRSATKQTFPGKLDNITAGGLTSGLQTHECAVKELDEEANINGDLINELKAVGAISYAYENIEEGIYRETEFIFDLKLPTSFVPVNKDGEAQSFVLMTIDQVKEALASENFDFKPNSALITLNFLMRHGFITPDSEPNYLYILEKMHGSNY